MDKFMAEKIVEIKKKNTTKTINIFKFIKFIII